MKNALPWIAIPVALACGFAICWFAIVGPAGSRAAALLAQSKRDYLAAQGEIDRSARTVTELTKELATKDSQLQLALATVYRAQSQVGAIAADFRRFGDALAAGSLGLGDDAKALGQLSDLIKTSIALTGRLQAGDGSGRAKP